MKRIIKRLARPMERTITLFAYNPEIMVAVLVITVATLLTIALWSSTK